MYFSEASSINNVEAIADLGRDNQEPLANFKIWIRDDGCCRLKRQMPDTDNDEI